MRQLLFLALAAALAPAQVRGAEPATGGPTAGGKPLTSTDRAACAAEVEVLEKRLKLFGGQGLSKAEIARRNESSQAALDECVRIGRLTRAAEAERAADVAELDRRAGPDASEEVRSEIWTQLRLERLSAKPSSQLTEEEKAELRAGNKAELAETHATLDTAHAKDPGFMRLVHSSLACYHGVRRDQLKDELRHEESLLKLGKGDRQKVYALKSDLRQSDDVLARSREAATGYRDGLARCTEEKVAVLAHCLSVRFDGKRPEPACESEEIQQYIRFIK